MTVGMLSRDSMKRALRLGITAEQVTHFLQVHAHKEMYKNLPGEYYPIPRTVGDQLHLWERERFRLKTSAGTLYNGFTTPLDYETVKTFARRLGLVLWSDDVQGALIVKQEGHASVKEFWRQRKAELGYG